MVKKAPNFERKSVSFDTTRILNLFFFEPGVLTLGFDLLALGSGLFALSSGLCILGSVLWALGFELWLLGFGLWSQGSGFDAFSSWLLGLVSGP